MVGLKTSKPDSSFRALTETFHRLFENNKVNQLAYETGFCQRRSKLQGTAFFSSCVFFAHSIANETLLDLSAHLEKHAGICISPQGLHERFNEEAARFLEQFLNQLVQTNLTEETSLLKESSIFKRIRIMDSTAFILDPMFANEFPGSGGARHTAGAKIQLEYDLFSGRVLENYLGAEKEGDKQFSDTHLSQILPGDLCIRDLGYFDLKDHQAIQDTGGYYITRVKASTRLYIKNPTPESFKNTNKQKKHSQYLPISLEELADTLKPGETVEFPEVYCGKGHYLGARVIVHCLNAKELTNRKQQIEKLAQKRKPLSERSKKIKKLNVYVTNCPAVHVPMDMVHELYSLRWQIELLFKTWKSVFKINKVKKVNIYRLKCHIYSKLIALWLTMTTMYKMRKLMYERQGKELSEYKAMHVLIQYLPDIWHALMSGFVSINRLLNRVLTLLKRSGLKSRKGRKKTCMDILGPFIR